jgi:proteasome lid subunit RPN8/RPN11
MDTGTGGMHDPTMQSVCSLTDPAGPVLDPPTTLILPEAVRRSMVAWARAEQPNEAVGILATVRAGPGLRAVAWFPGTNVDASPVRYTMAPSEVRSTIERIARAGWQPGAIVHSHPRHPAVPSATDLDEHRHRDALMVIISLTKSPPDITAWYWRPNASCPGGRMAEVAVQTAGLPARREEKW